MKLTINIDKEVLFMTRYCKYQGERKGVYFTSKYGTIGPGGNCAIAYAVQKIFPNANVGLFYIYPFYYPNAFERIYIEISKDVRLFINSFDSLDPEERLKMQPFSFEIEVPQEVIDHIGIKEIHKSLKESKHVELV